MVNHFCIIFVIIKVKAKVDKAWAHIVTHRSASARGWGLMATLELGLASREQLSPAHMHPRPVLVASSPSGVPEWVVGGTHLVSCWCWKLFNAVLVVSTWTYSDDTWSKVCILLSPGIASMTPTWRLGGNNALPFLLAIGWWNRDQNGAWCFSR